MACLMVVYRIVAAAAFKSLALPFLEKHLTMAVVATGAVVHFLMITIMTKVCGGCGVWGRDIVPLLPLLSPRPSAHRSIIM